MWDMHPKQLNNDRRYARGIGREDRSWLSNHGRWSDESRLSSLQNAMCAPQMPGQRNTQLLEALRRSVYQLSLQLIYNAWQT